jgi:hypothetical protein
MLLPKAILSLAREITICCDRQVPPQSLSSRWSWLHVLARIIVFNLFPARLLLMKIPFHRQSECHGGEGARRGIWYPGSRLLASPFWDGGINVQPPSATFH